MNTTNLMKDPFFAPILQRIETRLAMADTTAQDRGISLTDSQMRSALLKVRKTAEGSPPKEKEPTSPREILLAELHTQLLETRDDFTMEDTQGNREPLQAKAWILALRTIEDSIRLRMEGNGSRAYLEFVRGFLQSGTMY